MADPGVNGHALIDYTAAHAARIYDYLLGGVTNFPVDREMARQVFSAFDGGIETARAHVRANRGFLGRVVRHLAGEVGIDQFLDVGTGVPTEDGNSVHEVLRDVAPRSRVVYVDNDPIVLAHAHELLDRLSPGAARYVAANLRDPEEIVDAAAGTLDFGRPVGLLLLGVLHFVGDDEDPYGIVAQLLDAVPEGSYLVVSHLASDIHEQTGEIVERSARQPFSEDFAFRTRDQVARFFTGLDLVEPGVVSVDDWRPSKGAPAVAPDGRPTPIHCGVGRKP